MSKHDRNLWAATTSLSDLGELTAQWLEGRIGSQPGYAPSYGPERETKGLIGVLARLNRAGYVTNCSQPVAAEAFGYDGVLWRQRAAVSGFADPLLASRITAAAEAVGLVVVVQQASARRRDRRRPVTVTERERVPVTQFGGRLTARDIGWLYSETKAVTALRDAVQISVIDPDWSRAGLLWQTLDHVARS